MWNNFEKSPTEDETISNGFSSCGLFKITSEINIENNPCVHAMVQNQKMVIAIDKTLVLLANELVAECSFLTFNSFIDVLAISRSGNLIMCGLSNGEVHGIFIKGTPLFSLNISAEDVHLTSKTFVNVQELGNRFLFSCTNGSVYSLSEINEKLLQDFYDSSLNANESLTMDENILGQVQIERLRNGRGLSGVTAALLISQQNIISTASDTVYIAGSENALHFRNNSNDSGRIVIPDRFGGVKQIYNLENFILVLTNSGHLLEVCPCTKLVSFPKPPNDLIFLIDEMIAMECSDENVELLVLEKTKANEDSREMKIIDYPSFKCLSELEVSLHAWLVQQPKCSMNLFYLSGKFPNIHNIPTELEMVLISETHPSERFKKLLAKGHLEEAEAFGRQFEICLQPLYEAKAKRIILDLSCAKNQQAELLEQDFTTLIELLQLIESKDFFRNNRMACMPTRNILERFLKEVQQHLGEDVNDGNSATWKQDDIPTIFEQLQRLETLAIIDPYECKMDWQKFVYNSNLAKTISTLFASDMITACLIWKRHSAVMISKLNVSEMQKLMELIPSNTEAFHLVQWLRHFLPTVCHAYPDIIPFVADWSIRKTRALQYSEHWPEIGLEFSTKVLEVFEEIEFMFSDMRRQYERSIVKICELVNALQELAVLKQSFNLVFTLDNYLQDSIDETALCLLQRVNLDRLTSLVNDFLCPIFQEKGKSPVAAICRYITLMVASRNSFNSWLERAVACIQLLHNEDDRLESALLVLQNAPVPWPDSVTPLKKFRNSTHPLALKINTEYEIQVIKIMKVKYGWPVASDINLNLFMFRIVRLNLPEMLEDICVLTKAAPEIATSAYFTCCYEIVRAGKIEVAYEFFKKLLADKQTKQTAELVELFEDVLERNPLLLYDDKSIEEQRNLIEFYKIILPHTHDSSVARNRWLAVQRSFILQTKFGLSVSSISKLVSIESRLGLLDLGITNIVERSNATVKVCNFIASEIQELCTALDMNKMIGINRICKRLQCLPLTCALAWTMLESVDCVPANSKEFIDLALELLAQQIEIHKRKTQTTNYTLVNEPDTLAFPLAHKLLVLAAHHEKHELSELIDLIKFVQIVSSLYKLNAISDFYQNNEHDINEQIRNALELGKKDDKDSFVEKHHTNSKKRHSVSVFDEIEVHEKQVPEKASNSNNNFQLHVARFLSLTLLMMVCQEKLKNCFFSRLGKLINEDVKENVEIIHKDFFDSLEQIIKIKAHNIWYITAQYLLEYQNYNQISIINADFVSLQLMSVLRNLMTQKHVNFVELFVLLVADKNSKPLLEKLSVSLKTDQQKQNFLMLSEMYNKKFDAMDEVETIRAIRIKHFYYMEFSKEDPTIKSKFIADVDRVDKLLEEFRNKKLNVQLIERMSHDFGLDHQQILITQVISILQSQELQYEIKTDAFGDEELVMTSSVECIRNLCQPYINEITNTEALRARLKQFISEVNIYFYELYLCVIEILSAVDDVPKEMQIWKSILHFLQHKMITRRRNRPVQLETDIWLKMQPEIGILPKIARYRLPFKPIVEHPLKDILDNELSVDNCESWFPLIQLHTALKGSNDILSIRDYFCMSAVKNSIGDYKSKNDSETWHLQPTNNAFLKSVLRLVNHVSSPSKALMILYFVSNYAPDGADQVEASFECFKYALAKESLILEEKYQQPLIKIKRKYPILKTQHLLYVYGLTDENLMRLVENPTELITNLYYHKLVLKSCKLDINKVANEIAILHELDLEIIQFKLLQKWLMIISMDSTDGTVMDDTFIEEHNHAINNSIEESCNAAENVIRANFILNSWPKKKAIEFLVAYVNTTNGNVTTSQQLQIFECLSMLNDGSDFFGKLVDQRKYVAVKCVHELKQLGHNSSIDKFIKCNKIDLLKTIWVRNKGNPRSLAVMVNICLGFDIYEPRVWNGILKRMSLSNMVRELNAIVDVVSCQPHLLQTEGLIAAWECVLKQPFKNANRTRLQAEEEQLHKALFRLQGCPVLHKLNLLELAHLSVLIDRPHIAAVLLAFCKSSEQRMQIKEKIDVRKKDQLRKNISNLEDAGILSIVLNFALKELEL